MSTTKQIVDVNMENHSYLIEMLIDLARESGELNARQMDNTEIDEQIQQMKDDIKQSFLEAMWSLL